MYLHLLPNRLNLRRHISPLALVLATFAWLLTATGLPAQEPASIAAPDKSDAQKPIFEEWVVVVMKGRTCGYGSTVTTKTDTPTGSQYLTVHQE